MATGKTWVLATAIVFFIAVILGASIETTVFGLDKVSPWLLKYIFLGTDDYNSLTGDAQGLAGISLLITALMVWLIVFVTFGDIIENFSTFSPVIAWIIAFAMGIISANVGAVRGILIWMTAVFIWAGTAAVYLGLFASFVVFLAINWGIGSAGKWFHRRKTLSKAAAAGNLYQAGQQTLARVARQTQRDADQDYSI